MPTAGSPQNPPSDTQSFTAETGDPAEFELALRPWELLCKPLIAGEFRHQISAIKSENFVLYREHYNLPVRLQGLSPGGMLGLCIPLNYNQDLNYWGSEYSASSIVAALPGSADAILSQGYAHTVVLINIARLRQAIPNDDYERLERAARAHIFSVSPEFLGHLAGWANRLLNEAESQTVLFEKSTLVDGLFLQLIDLLLRLSAELPPRRSSGTLATRHRGLSLALDYLRDHLDSRVSVADLCRVAGVSERTLQYAFRDEFGVSPNAFMRQRRLHAVRRALTTSSAANCTVSEVAQAHGFTELGRFAVDYRQLFGVRPSDTLKSHA